MNSWVSAGVNLIPFVILLIILLNPLLILPWYFNNFTKFFGVANVAHKTHNIIGQALNHPLNKLVIPTIPPPTPNIWLAYCPTICLPAFSTLSATANPLNSSLIPGNNLSNLANFGWLLPLFVKFLILL